MSDYRRISVIIPAFQESGRIGGTITAWSSYLNENYPNSEIILVCDGCTDNTAEMARSSLQASSNCTLEVIELPINQGKGKAVQTGVLKAAQDLVVYTDSDLSYLPNILNQFIEAIEEGADIAIAQRSKDEKYPGFGRRLIASISRFVIGNFVLPGVRDTQAGFKLFKREVAVDIFKKMTINRFLFDLEILTIANIKKYKIEKIYVDWQDRPGSTVRIYLDTMRSGRDLLLIMMRKLAGKYR
ncbi:glycosyltransferase [bacterium]|nr:glycosyltransferase [bacterium]QQR57530.1 MAG: glycosyltransferase [Candidatus Melainabacteria bacterium]